jgi:hypothetical protein
MQKKCGKFLVIATAQEIKTSDIKLVFGEGGYGRFSILTYPEKCR